MSTKGMILDSLSDASEMIVVLRYNLDKLIDQCEFENRHPSIQELRDLKEQMDDAETFITKIHKIING